jgi:hypothetical protein
VSKEIIVQVIEETEALIVIHIYSLKYLLANNRKEVDDLYLGGGFDVCNIYSRGEVIRTYGIGKAVAKFKNKQGARMIHEYVNVTVKLKIIEIYELIQEFGYYNTSPEFEFLRHIRNAMGHGYKFNFKYGEPKRPASFNGIVIEQSLNGRSVLDEFILPGDILDLINYIKSAL